MAGRGPDPVIDVIEDKERIDKQGGIMEEPRIEMVVVEVQCDVDDVGFVGSAFRMGQAEADSPIPNEGSA